MASKGPRDGPEAFWFFFGIAAVAAVLHTYWYVVVAIGVIVMVVYFATKKGRVEQREREQEVRRFAVYRYGKSAEAHHGRNYVFMLSRSMELLAAGEAPTFAMLQRQLHVPRSTADWIMLDLERLEMVSGNIDGKRRTTLASPDILRDSAWVLRTG